MNDSKSREATSGCAANTDKEVWRSTEGDYYSKHKLYVTESGALRLCEVGHCITMLPEDWFKLATRGKDWKAATEDALARVHQCQFCGEFFALGEGTNRSFHACKPGERRTEKPTGAQECGAGHTRDELVEAMAEKICQSWGYLWAGDADDDQVAPDVATFYDERPDKVQYRDAASAALAALEAISVVKARNEHWPTSDVGNLMAHMAEVVGALRGWDKENTAVFQSAQYVLDALRKMYEPTQKVEEGELAHLIESAALGLANDNGNPRSLTGAIARALLRQFDMRRK